MTRDRLHNRADMKVFIFGIEGLNICWSLRTVNYLYHKVGWEKMWESHNVHLDLWEVVGVLSPCVFGVDDADVKKTEHEVKNGGTSSENKTCLLNGKFTVC